MNTHVIAKGKFFNKTVRIKERKNYNSLVSLNSIFESIDRTLIVPNDFIISDKEHHEKILKYFNIARYLAKKIYENYNNIELHQQSLNSLFLFINFNYYKKYGKQLFEDEIYYEKYKLGYFNPYMKYGVKNITGFSSIVQKLEQDNHIPVYLTEEQEEFILNTIKGIYEKFKTFDWVVLYDYEENLMKNDLDYKKFFNQFMYNPNLNDIDLNGEVFL